MVKLFGDGTGNSVYESTNDTTNTANATNQIRSIRNKIRNSYTERSARGFTLAEMLVVIFIFTVITGGVVANFRVGERSTELRLGAERIASALRNMQNMAQTGEQIAGHVPLGGYGVKVTSDGFVFFADLNNNGQYDSPGEELPNMLMNMPTVVGVKELSTNLAQNLSEVDVVFVPPAPEVYINACDHNAPRSSCPTSARITVKHARTDQTSTIVVQRLSGRIEVE